MRLAIVALLGISSIADGDDTTQDAALRGGVCWFETDSGQGPQARGFAPYVDGELGIRWDYVSLTATGSMFSLRSHFDWSDQNIRLRSDARYVGIDAGGRLTFHGTGRESPFFGVGVALETFHESGQSATCACANDLCDPCLGGSYQPFARWSEATLLEIHAGFDKLTSLGLLDVIAIGGLGGDPDPSDDNGWLWTLRLAAGVRF